MKKIYSVIAVMAIAGSAFAQITNKPLYQEKDACDNVPSAMSGNNNASNRAVLWSEDFANGIPATWSNVTTTGPVDWKYTTVGHTGDYPTAALASTTSGNGWIIVDSDGDNFSGGGAEDAQLTTDVIDLTGSGNIKLEFEQMFREWQVDVTTVRLSTDGGATWTDWEINIGVGQSGTPNPDIVTIDITAAVAANPANVQIGFWWQGSWDYGWQIDDVNISDIPANDLKIRKQTFANTGLEYFQNKTNQLQPYGFSAFIRNQGSTAQTNVALDVDVSDGATSVFTGSSAPVASQPVGQEDSFAVASPFTPAGIGNYTATFTAVADQTDDDLSNNTLMQDFSVTDCIMARDNNIVDGRLGNGFDSYEYGCLYEIQTDDDLTQIDVYLRSDTTVPGALIYGVVYEDDGAGGQTYLDQTSDYTIQASDLDGWISLAFNTPVGLTAGGVYYVMVGSYGGADEVWIGRGSNPAPDQTCFILDGADNTWYYTNRTPMVRAGLGTACSTGINDITENGITLGQNFPNPFDGTSTITYTLNQASQVSLEVIDVTGKQVMLLNEGNKAGGQQFNIELDATNLEAGVYFYSLITENGRVTRQMVVAK